MTFLTAFITAFLLTIMFISLSNNRAAKKELETIKDEPQPEICETCGCLIAVGQEQRVKVTDFSNFSLFREVQRFYCKSDKKPYKSIIKASIETYYYAELEVNEDGTPKVEKKKAA